MSAQDWVALDDVVEEILLAGKNGQAGHKQEWLTDAADLLAEPDPGPTPWLVQDLIVDGAIIAAVGRWKTTKSYGLLDLCISIATGQPAFGVHEIPNPGPVIFINEESGRTALRRRLDSLTRGRAIPAEQLRDVLLVGANTRIKLDNQGWQNELIELGIHLQPRLFVFDPLARMKASSREENAQTEMAPLIEFLRQLRHETGAAVCFVHHTGHQGEQMRGSSDLESAWETRLTWKRDGQSPTVTIASEHREAEAAEPVTYQIRFDSELRTMRFAAVDDAGIAPLADRILAEIEANQDTGMTTDEVRAAVNVRRSDVVRTLEIMEVAGTAYRTPSQRRDGMGRQRTWKVWKAGTDPTLRVTAMPSQRPDGVDAEVAARAIPSHRPTSLEGGGTDGVPDGPKFDDDIPF
jgi:hypothetical protein